MSDDAAVVSLSLRSRLIITSDRRGFAHVEFSTVEDAKAVIEAHEALPMHDKSKRLIRINYDDQKPPWRVLCVSGFEGTPEEIEAIFAEHGCDQNLIKVTTCKTLLSSTLSFKHSSRHR